MQILVIGASGYVGRHVAAALRNRGHGVIGTVRTDASAEQLRSDGIVPLIAEFDEAEPIHVAAQNAEATIFVARILDQSETRDGEYRHVSALLHRLKGQGRTFVFTSGTGLFGEQTDGEWSERCYSETDAFVVRPELSRRAATERLVTGARGVRGIVIRPPLIWGNELPSQAVHILRSIVEEGAACYVGRGLNAYSNVHVEDLGDLYALALERGATGAVYHAVSGEAPTRWLAETMAAAANVSARSVTIQQAEHLWGAFNAQAVMGACSRASAPRARNELGWLPQRFDLLDELTALTREAVQNPAEISRVLARRPIPQPTLGREGWPGAVSSATDFPRK